MTTVIPFEGERLPFILRATWRAGKADLATLFRVTGINVLTNEFVAVSTIDPSDVRKFPQAARHEEEDGAVCMTFADGQNAFAYAKGAGFRMATV